MSKVLGLDSKTSGVAAWFGFTSGSTALMILFALIASYLAWVQAHRPHGVAATPGEIDIVREEAPPPPPPEPVKEEEKPAAAPHVMRDAPPPPAAPAAAAKVVTAEPDSKEVDLTNTVVEGNADAFAGGLSANNGTSTTAVHSLPAPSGVPGGTGPVTAPPPAPPPGPDLSRPPSNAGGAEWNAPFPSEADSAQIDEAYVVIKIDVRADGTPSSVQVLKDPGNGFGREARRYALTKRYNPAFDHDGHPTTGTFRINVHFSR
jgi:protein TonB